MTKIDVTRTELVWPGKYDEGGNLVVPERVSLPFQVIERVNQTRATRVGEKEALAGHTGTLFDFWQADEQEQNMDSDDWKNKLIWGDNLYVMSSLLENLAGKIDLIYIDPPFATGADFSFKSKVGDLSIKKEQSILEEKAYRDTWKDGSDSFINWLFPRISLMKDFLSPSGNFFIHLDWHIGPYIKCILDSIFGEEYFKNEIIWHYRTGNLSEKQFQRKHDNIYFYSKSNDNYFKPLEEKEYYKDVYGPNFKPSFKGRKHGEDEKGEYRISRVDDVWDISAVFTLSNEHLPYDTQKPEALLSRIIESSCPDNGVVADFFMGSGTTIAVAEKMGMKWVGCDLSRYAIHTTRKRLMDIEGCKPFEILNLGKYERQVWQGIVFGKEKQEQKLAIFEYLKFILELYGAQPLAGTTHLHGKKGQSVVHVGAVDAPVTFDEINACLDECEAMKQKSLHVLGWEWEMGVANNMVDVAKGRGINLLLLNIPREVMEKQAVDKGDIHFYELAYLEIENIVKGKEAQIKLTDFNIPNDELISPDVREKIKKWSDFVDYWAVDWDFQNDTFVNGWTDYRTNQKRELKLITDFHTYDKAGTYQVMVKVIDIFGNDTSQIFPLEITA